MRYQGSHQPDVLLPASQGYRQFQRPGTGGPRPPHESQRRHSASEESKLLDVRKEALQLIQSGAGTITPFSIVYDNGMRMEQLYDGKHFPPYLHDAYPLVLEAPSKQAPEEKPEYLYLPASQRQIERALCRAGAASGADLQFQIEINQLPEQTAALN